MWLQQQSMAGPSHCFYVGDHKDLDLIAVNTLVVQYNNVLQC